MENHQVRQHLLNSIKSPTFPLMTDSRLNPDQRDKSLLIKSKPMQKMHQFDLLETKGPLALIILDGWGMRLDKRDNGIELARKPFFDSLIQKYPHTLIEGSGPAVGLPAGVMGNSEVGHMNLGAGRIVFSGLSQIYQSIEDKSFFKNLAFLQAIEVVKRHQSRL